MVQGYLLPSLARAAKGVGKIEKYLHLPCHTDNLFLAVTAGEALLKLLLDAVSPDLKFIYHELSGESIVGELAHAATGRKQKCRPLLFTEEANEGRNLSDGELIDPESEIPGKRFIFKLAAYADSAAWIAFLLAIAAEGLYDWSSMLLRDSKCQNPHDPNFGSGGDYIGAIDDDGTFSMVPFTFGTGSKFSPVSPTSVIAKDHRLSLCMGACQFHAWLSSAELPVAVRTIAVNSRIIFDHYEMEPDEFGTGKGIFSYHQQIWAGVQETIQTQWSSTAGPLPLGEAFCKEGSMMAALYEPN